MLKRLELIGFKSFADRTRFDFGPGVTAVVGPNGSGKSNVVDAIRWILGEQSAKSLRGKEMSDVIFNGSGGRRSLGMAEVSLSFDNTRHFLPFETDEVSITRRVYRNGEGEYLINGQIARLRDIKEMFLGTGAGIGAYSIIEQGKVDQMLQASAQDRRAIFEEAAGVSKFRVQKAETMRRLDRVGQNLLRIQDIHEELEKQLRGLRSQAGKARKYKEYADRLKELRVGVGRHDLRRFDGQLDAFESTRRTRNDESALLETQSEVDRAMLEELEAALAEAESGFAERSARLADLRQRLTATQADMSADRGRMSEAENQAIESGQRLLSTGRLAAAAENTHANLSLELKAKSDERNSLAEQVDSRQAADSASMAEIWSLRTSLDGAQRRSMQLVQNLARLENEQSGLESNLRHAVEHRDRLSLEIAVAGLAGRQARLEEIAFVNKWLATSQHATQFNSMQARLANRRGEITDRLSATGDDLSTARRTQAILAERIDVLEMLRRRHEGLGGGVREVLERRDRGDAAWRSILGVLAERISAPTEYAHLVELALGAHAQALLVETPLAIDESMENAAQTLAGRVLVVPIEPDPRVGQAPMVILPEDFTNPSLADVVDCSNELRPLVDRLLGGVYVVDDLATARQSANALHVQSAGRSSGQRMSAADFRFISRTGEMLEPDGSLSAGAAKESTAGIVARHAELRDLQLKKVEVDSQVGRLELELATHKSDLKAVDRELSDVQIRIATLTEQQAHFAHVVGQLRRRQAEVWTQFEQSKIGRDATVVEIEQLHVDLSAADEAVEGTHDELKTLNDAIDAQRWQLSELEGRRESDLAELNGGKVELAKADERLRSLRADIARTVESLAQHRSVIQQESDRVEQARARIRNLEPQLLAAAARFAELASNKDSLGDLAEEAEAIAQGRERRRAVATRRDAVRQRLDRLRALSHADELQATQARLERQNLIDRTREDYGIDLTIVPSDGEASLDESAIDAGRLEIAELREKISRLGAVNLEAIRELEELEGRSNALRHQMNDLAVAERHLQQVIGQINEESRRLFIDTFETVRGHFGELFRRIFGGGKADVLLEDETDVLESGIEIIARPPGKEPRSISLLSGGEKTMAAVALLMALFRSKPSPFCILDEVDAALDEANIGRFVALIREFTGESQFVLITHSKTTMAAADMLHGVTQRESGVSLRVSVRLEDVDEEGRIAASALAT